MPNPKLSSLLEILMAALTFTVLAVYGYALLFEIPYLGFVVERPVNLIIVLNTGNNPSDALKSNDHLPKVDGLTWDRFAELFIFSIYRTDQTQFL